MSELGYPSEASQLNRLAGHYYVDIGRVAALVAQGNGAAAALKFGRESQPAGSYGAFLAELHRASLSYDRGAARSRRIGSIGSAAALVSLLLAFSVALYRATRLAREKHQLLERSRIEALTDP